MPITGLDKIGLLLLDNAQTISIAKAYNQVGFFRRAVDIRQNGIANMPFALVSGETEIVNEQTIDNVELSLGVDVFDLIPAWSTDLDLYGAAYGLLLVEDELAITGQGWIRIHPSRVTPVYDNLGVIRQWQIRTFTTTATVPVERLLYIWQPNQITDRGHGEPLARAALVAAGILSFSGTFQSMFFEKGALNPTIVSVEGLTKQAPTEQNRVRDTFRKLFGGLTKAHQIQVVDGKTTVNSLQQPLKDMALTELTKGQKEEVATTLGVPFSLVVSNAANYATATQDDFNFYDKAIVPLVTEIIAKQLNKKLFKPLGFSLNYQASRLDAFQAIELQKAETLNGMLDRKVISINEYRESMGLEPIEVTEEEPPKEEIAEEPALQEQLKTMKEAVSAGIPPEQAAKMVGLEVATPATPNNETKSELKKWRKMAVKRYLEEHPEKALKFASDIIPVVLSDKIKAALATVETVDSVNTIFNDAVLYA